MADNSVSIVDQNGVPVKSPARTRASALAGYGGGMGAGQIGGAPYDAANVYDQRMEGWIPGVWSADTELNAYRDRIVSRARDIVRNDGWAAGAITRVQDNVIGSEFRPLSKPDHRALRFVTGLKSFDAVWADEFGKTVEAHYRTWAMDVGRYCDASRHLTVPQMLRLGFRHKIIDGDVLAKIEYLKERRAPGRARYATCINLIDPDRLSNPNQSFDTALVRGGVAINDFGEPLGYHIRKAHPGDWYNAWRAFSWDYVPRETAWGRPIMLHDYEHDRAAQHRGGAGILTPILQRLKMLVKYDGAELDAAIINAIFGAYVTSPFDPALMESALGSGQDLNFYQDARAEFHNRRDISLGGARIPTLFPGEAITPITATRPNQAFTEFEGTMLRNVAACLGISYEQISQDWSKTNYSSARAAILEAWKTMTRRRIDYSNGFCTPMFAAWLEESFELDDLPLPAGAPDFPEHRTAYAGCKWIGPGRGWVDPVKEKEGAMLGMEAGLSTLEMEAAESGGVDWEENLEQRAVEIKKFTDLNLPLPAMYREADDVIQSEKVG
jgi:lambda family phage portal protein